MYQKVFMLQFTVDKEKQIELYTTIEVAWNRKQQLSQSCGYKIRLTQQVIYQKALTTDYIYTGGRD